MAASPERDAATNHSQHSISANSSHRQLLANLETNMDSASDVDVATEDEPDFPSSSSQEDHSSNVVGISMGDAQDRMRSPRTPAAEKIRALEEFQSYFPDHATEVDALVEEPKTYDQSLGDGDDDTIFPSTAGHQALLRSRQIRQDGTSTPEQRQAKRHSLVGSILHAGTSRPRASSGSSILGSFKRMLPDLPTTSLQLRGSMSRRVDVGKENKSSQQDSHAALTGQQSHETLNHGQQPIDQIKEMQQTSIGLDGSAESKVVENETKPPILRRATSDQSLYLRRTATGASQWDSTTPFADRSDMVNSRFKAITDSLQDSSIRLPKFSGVSFNSKRPTSSRTASDETRANTLTNSGRDTSTISRHPHGDQSGSVGHDGTQHPLLTAALGRSEGDIVIMGGYRGSILRDAKPPYRQVWVPLKVGLNIRKVDLEVGLTREDEERMEETIVPSGTLSHIGPVDISRRLLRKCRKCHNARTQQLRIHDWGYDWRLSPHLIASKLTSFLESLECNKKGVSNVSRGALVIAHSLGGLITRHVVNQRPELFKGVIYAGTPQHCVNILGPLRNGDDVLFSSKVLTAQVNFTLRTSYALLPESGQCFVNKDTGERYDIDFFDAKIWDKYRLSPCINEALSHSMKHNRRSLVGSISETILNYTPSLPGTKKSSLFGNGSHDANGNGNSSSANQAKEKIESTKDQIGEVAKQVKSPEKGAGRSLEPSMADGQGQKSFAATTTTISPEKAHEYLCRTLAEVKAFKSELAHRPDLQKSNKYPPHAIIFGKGEPTVYGAKVASREAIQYSDAYDDLAFASGDGVVLASAAQLPKGYRCIKGGRVESDRGHVGLLGDLEGVGRCINAVLDARDRGVGFGNYS